MIEQRSVSAYLQDEDVNTTQKDTCISITLNRVLDGLMQGDARKAIADCLGSMSEALQELMRRASEE